MIVYSMPDGTHEGREALFGALEEVLDAGPDEPASRTLRAMLREALCLVPGVAQRKRNGTLVTEVARFLPSSEERERFVRVAIVAACAGGEVTQRAEQLVSSYAQGLGVTSPFVSLLGALRRGRVLAIKRALGTRSPDARRLFSRTWKEDGVAGLLNAIWFVLGMYRAPELGARFRKLSEAPPGSFGRAFFEHITSRHLNFPGERGGVPERMVHHDLLHVLGGYDTTPEGECELAGFYAGFAEGEPFTFIMTVLATFHLGLPVSPAAVKPAKGAFDPLRVLRAYERGRRVQVDVMGPWNYWELFPLPLEEARRRIGIGEQSS